MTEAQPGAVKAKAAPKKSPAKANIAKSEDSDGDTGNSTENGTADNVEGQLGDTNIRLNERDGLTITTEIDGEEVELNIGGEE